MTVERRLRQFVIENFYVSDPAELHDDTLLVSGGYVDSTGMLEVIGFLEQEFDVRIADQEMTPENLDSISRMAAFLARKRREAAVDGRAAAAT